MLDPNKAMEQMKSEFAAGAASRDAEVAQQSDNYARALALVNQRDRDIHYLKEECDQLRAQINKLRDVVKVVETDSEEVLDFDECTAMCVPMDSYHDLVDAAEATPEQSLAEYRNKVIEECAAKCKDKHVNGNWMYDYREECEAAILDMKEQP